MTYLEAVNRLLRENDILTGDDDNLKTLTSAQHQTTSNRAQLAIQNELVFNASLFKLRTERNRGTITLVTSQRVYLLEDDFVRFYGRNPFMFYSDNVQDYIYEYPGGFDKLRLAFREWESQPGRPQWWYFNDEESLEPQVGFYQVPSANENGLVLSYEYERTQLLKKENDLLPFHTEMQEFAFVTMASRRFRLMENTLPTATLEEDGQYQDARSAFVKLENHREAPKRYGRVYPHRTYRW